MDNNVKEAVKEAIVEYNLDGILGAILVLVAAIYLQMMGFETSVYWTGFLAGILAFSRTIVRTVFWLLRGLGELYTFIKYAFGRMVNGE
jgi:hypothetical protein